MTRDCSLNSLKSTSSQHVVCNNCFLLLLLFWHSKKLLYTTCCALVLFREFNEQSLNILWVYWFKNESFWKRFTFTVTDLHCFDENIHDMDYYRPCEKAVREIDVSVFFDTYSWIFLTLLGTLKTNHLCTEKSNCYRYFLPFMFKGRKSPQVRSRKM